MGTARRRDVGRIIPILIAVAGLYLVGNHSVGLWDRDEPRYAQTSKQMLLSDPPNWVVPRLLDDVRTAKPIFIYWCQALAMKVVGATTPFAARLPSVVAMLVTLSVLAVVIGRSTGWRRATWTVFILGTSALAIAAAKMCIIDSVLLLWVVIAQLCLYAVYRGRGTWPVVVTMWLAVGVAGLTKGPVILVVQVSTILVLAALDVGERWRSRSAWADAIRWWRRTRPVVGILIVAAVVSPWLWGIERHAPGFLRTTLMHDVLARAVKPLEGHRGPPGYYLLTIWATFMPWCLFLPAAAVLGWKNRRLAPLRFALAAAIGPWVVMEFVQTKLVHYVLPAFPAIAFLTADALVRCVRGQERLLAGRAFIVGAAAWSLAVAAVGFAPWLLTRTFPATRELCVAMTLISAGGVVYAAVVFVNVLRRRLATAATAMGAGMIIVIALFYGLYLPNAYFLWIPQRVAAVLHAEGATTKGDVVMLDFAEDSLPYYQGGTIRAVQSKDLTGRSPDDLPRWIVLTREAWEGFGLRVASQYEEVSSVRGLAYADGQRVVEVLVIRKR